MENKVIFYTAIKFYIQWDEGNSKNMAESKKMGVVVLYDVFWLLNIIYIDPRCESGSYFR